MTITAQPNLFWYFWCHYEWSLQSDHIVMKKFVQVFSNIIKMNNSLHKFLLLFIATFCLTTCQKVEFEIEDVPNCFKKKVRKDNPLIIHKWEVDNQVFYQISYNDCFDCFNELFDENCDYVCAPSGGISGGGDGNCPTWNDPITWTLVWQIDWLNCFCKK